MCEPHPAGVGEYENRECKWHRAGVCKRRRVPGCACRSVRVCTGVRAPVCDRGQEGECKGLRAPTCAVSPPPQDQGPPGPRDAGRAPRAPSPRQPPHPQHPSGSGPRQTQTSWVTPLLKDPLLTDAYQPHLLGPLHTWPSALLPPIRAPGGLRLQGHQGLPWPGRHGAHPASQPPTPT